MGVVSVFRKVHRNTEVGGGRWDKLIWSVWMRRDGKGTVS